MVVMQKPHVAGLDTTDTFGNAQIVTYDHILLTFDWKSPETHNVNRITVPWTSVRAIEQNVVLIDETDEESN